jgi:hypothetical protein
MYKIRKFIIYAKYHNCGVSIRNDTYYINDTSILFNKKPSYYKVTDTYVIKQNKYVYEYRNNVLHIDLHGIEIKISDDGVLVPYDDKTFIITMKGDLLSF